MRKRKKKIILALAVLLVLSAAAPCSADPAEEELIRQGPGVYCRETVKSAAEGSAETAGNVLSAGSSDRTVSGQKISLDPSWTYADFSVIRDGTAVLYKAASGRKNRCVAVNAGHGTKGGTLKKTYSHPDRTGKVTGGTNAAGAVKSMCVSAGMTFNDGTPEAEVTLKEAQILKEKLLAAGYDVLMIRDGADVQLDNVARTVIANNMADIHIALHWDSDGRKSIKGAFYMSVPDSLKSMEPVRSVWQKSEALGDSLIKGLEIKIPGIKIYSSGGYGQMDMDLTQTSFSTIPSVDIELGNQCSRHDDAMLTELADGLAEGVGIYFQSLM